MNSLSCAIKQTPLKSFGLSNMSLIAVSIYGLCLFVFLALPARAGINVYEFDDPAKDAQFYSLIDELRCPKCQNQNLTDSDAPLAKDLKNRVFKLVNEGKSDAEITGYLVDRYGDFVTYRPPVRPSTWVLWYGPLIIFFVVAIIIVIRVKSRAQAAAGAVVQSSNSLGAAKIEAVLAKYALDPLEKNIVAKTDAAASIKSSDQPSDRSPGNSAP